MGKKYRGGKKPAPASSTDIMINEKSIKIQKSLKEAIDSLFRSIVLESSKRIKSIKNSTAEALANIAPLYSVVANDCKSTPITSNSVLKLKTLILKSEECYKKQIDNFCSSLDVIDIEISEMNAFVQNLLSLQAANALEIEKSKNAAQNVVAFRGMIEIPGQKTNSVPVQMSSLAPLTKISSFPAQKINNTLAETFSPAKACEESNEWGTINNSTGVWQKLPTWIITQIEDAERSDRKEVMIYKNSDIVSIADLRYKKYYGAKNGRKIEPGQTLLKRTWKDFN